MNSLADRIMEDAAGTCLAIDFSEMNGKTIMITGAAGLVGVHLTACLKTISNNKKVNFQTILPLHSVSPAYFNEIANFSNVTLLYGDLTDNVFLNSLPSADYILHAAGYGQPGRFLENPLKTIQINTTATIELLKKLKPQGKFLFISTSEVYSGLKNPPYHEDDIGSTNTTHPRACYIESKRCGEAICNSCRANGIDAKSVRLSLAYGPGTKPGDKRVLNSFIEKGLNGNIDLLDKGEARRTYCYIADAVEIMWKVLFQGKNPIYNIGGFSKTTIAGLAWKIGKYLNVPVNIPQTGNDLPGAPGDVSLNMERVTTEFKKTAYVPFDAGLTRTIEWQKELYRRYQNEQER
ncbi:MAG: NAD-dependent epimerase/dehydratase family protein [Veillonellales bacterium]